MSLVVKWSAYPHICFFSLQIYATDNSVDRTDTRAVAWYDPRYHIIACHIPEDVLTQYEQILNTHPGVLNMNLSVSRNGSHFGVPWPVVLYNSDCSGCGADAECTPRVRICPLHFLGRNL